MNAVHLYRVGRWFFVKRVPIAPDIIKKIIFLIFNSYIPPSAEIGRGTVFAYGAIGVVIHADSKIGQNCVIGQGVTLGAIEGYASSQKNPCPSIGDDCYIGAGAKLLGGIRIGKQCQIGAGAVLLQDLPDNSVAVGVPAKIVGVTEQNFRAIRP